MGWTVGAGVEYALTQNWTAKVEYSYANFGTRTLAAPLCCTARTDIHTVKLGVNYLFSTGPSAVVARY
jgi:outer membrane immunogenic protein